MANLWIVLCTASALLFVAKSDSSDITVHTTSGDVKGKVVSEEGHSVESFLGIPFAKAPVGDLRFAPPEPFHQEGVIDATSYGHSCPQLTTGFEDEVPFIRGPEGEEEDCLNLNVWTPHPRLEHAAVLVFIHGGIGLALSGSAAEPQFDGGNLANSQGIVVVSMNYRLSEIGFLSLDIPEAPGNMGLMDQFMALKWVHDNIEKFGGDPNKVTLFGEGGGAISVGIHMAMMNGERGLFQQAILLDGAPLHEKMVLSKFEAHQIANNFSETAGCANVDAHEVLKCLREKSVAELKDATLKGVLKHQKLFGPVIDGKYLAERPKILTQSGNICHHLKVMIGTTYHRGFKFNQYIIQQKATEEHVVTQNDVRTLIHRMFKDESDFLRKLIEFHYTDSKHPDSMEAIRHEAIDLPNDYYNICPANQFTEELFKSGNDVYRFHLRFNKEAATYPKWAGTLEKEEFDLIFGHAVPAKSYTEKEHEFSNEVMGYFGRFVKTGNPNRDGHHDWPKYNIRDKSYFRLKPDSEHGGVAEKHFRTQECSYWQNGFTVARQGSHIMESRGCH